MISAGIVPQLSRTISEAIITDRLARDTYLIDGFSAVTDDQSAEKFIRTKLDNLKTLQKELIT